MSQHRYSVRYQYSSQVVKEVEIVATNPGKALEGAKIVLRKRFCGNDEILSITKVGTIDHVAR